MTEIIMLIGFMLAAYSIVGNDSIQTLGTFLYSNSHRKWWTLWLFSGSIMVAVMLYGWSNYNGDVSYDRLDKIYEKAVPFSAAEAGIKADTTIPNADEIAALIEMVKEVYLGDQEDLSERLEELRLEISAIPEDLSVEVVRKPTTYFYFITLAKPTTEEILVRQAIEDVITEVERYRDIRSIFTPLYLLPPIALLLLTRFGFPVSTSFIILITFQPAVLGPMVNKSLFGYLLAFVAALLIYSLVMRFLEKRWRDQGEGGITPIWVVFQWCSTAFLWSMWLIQDMANIFVYLPRPLPALWLVVAIVWMLAVQAFIYYSKGGEIQKVVQSKTNTHDIRSATIVDLLYGILLFYLKIVSNLPMSTTWVFLGLLAGREFGFALSNADKSLPFAAKLMSRDALKAGFGLGVSVAIAYLIAWLK